ncbi:phage tail protein [Aquamicrobium soli]|uniref:Phage tail protein n=1 Tax=Aquamicrobium soli TaxID=1811518 RepID=A0ABV7KEI0_9HYPH
MALFTAIAGAIGAVATAVSGFIGTALAAGGIGAFALKTAVGIGLNLLAQAIAGKPKAPTFSINGTLQSGGDLPRSFILGRTATAGSLVWVNTWGKDGDTPNGYLTQVIAISDLPVKSLDELWVNGEKCTIDYERPHADGRGYPVTEYKKGSSDSLWVRFYDGAQTAADSFLSATASNAQRSWSANRVGRGVAYAIVTARVSKKMFSSIPNFKFVVSGIPLYDITKDSTAGGSGTHRLSDPSTWGGDGDDLPAVQAYNLLHGLTFNGQWFYGLQNIAAARLPADNWIAAINKCRAPIAGASGNEPTYRSAGEIQIDAPLASALEAINTACQGRIAEVGGVYTMFVGAPDAPVASFTDDDILSTEEQSFTPFFGLADTINGISANYPSPEDGWAAKTAPPLYRTDLEALHGNRRLMADVPLDFVPYAEQVQRLMKSALEEGQRARRHTLVLPPQFWSYAVPGAILAWTSARNGYDAKLFRVDGVSDKANLDVMIDITEVDPSDFDWDTNTDFEVPVDGTVGPMRPAPQPIVDWFAEKWALKDDNGAPTRAAIRLTWDNSDGRLDGIDGVEYEVRLASDLSHVTGGRTDQPEAGSMVVSQGIVGLTTYGVRGRYIRDSGEDVLWSDWLPVTTDDIRQTDVTAYLSGVGQDVYATLQQLRADHDDLRARLEMIAAGSADATGASIDVHTVARRFQDATAIAMREMTASIEAKTRVYRQATAPTGDLADGDIWIDTDDGNKVRVWNATSSTWEDAGAKGLLTFAQDAPPTASNVGDLWVDTNDNSRLYRWDGTAWVDVSDARITAQASILDAVQAAVGNVSADGLRKIEVTAGAGDVVARLTDMVRATVDDAWVEAGTVTEVGFTGGDPLQPFARMLFVAGQFVFTDGTNDFLPVVIEDGEIKLAIANIGTVTAGVIKSPDDKFVITLSSGKLEWFD